mgnify:CR=1 FL=1
MQSEHWDRVMRLVPIRIVLTDARLGRRTKSRFLWLPFTVAMRVFGLALTSHRTLHSKAKR